MKKDERIKTPLLEECPMCGGHPVYSEHFEHHADDSVTKSPSITCKKCGLLLLGDEVGEYEDIPMDAKVELINRWNDRTEHERVSATIFLMTMLMLLVIYLISACAPSAEKTIPSTETVTIIADCNTQTPEPTPIATPKPTPAATQEPTSKPTQTPQNQESSQARYQLTDEERRLVEQVVMAEAGGEPYDGQRAVAQCILMGAEEKGVRPAKAITLYKYTPARKIPTESVQKAVRAVFDEGDFPINDRPIWFYAPASTSSSWHESMRYVGTIGNHRFFSTWD